MVGQRLDGELAGDVLGQHAEHLGVEAFAHDVHLTLHVRFESIELGFQFTAELGKVGDRTKLPGVEEFVEQNGMAGEIGGPPARGAEKLGNPFQGLWILLQQGEVGAATADGLQQIEDALERLVGIRHRGGDRQGARHDPVETDLVLYRHLLIAGAAANFAKAAGCGRGVLEAESPETVGACLRIACIAPYPVEGMVVLGRIAEHSFKVRADDGAVRIERRHELIVGRAAHRRCDQGLVRGVIRQVMGLGVVEILQPVLQLAQEVVGEREPGDGVSVENAALRQQRKHLQCGLDLQRKVAATAHELEHLGDELDLANAAGAELDVVCHVAARHLATDLGVQIAHRVDRAEIEILAEHEGPRDRAQLFAARAMHHPCLDPCVALPLAPLGDEIVLKHLEAAHQRSGVSVRPQTHVDAEDLALLGDLVEGLDELLAQLGEELEIADGFRAIGVAILRIDEDEVHIRGDVEFAPAELAHADHDQLLCAAAGVERLAVALGEGGVQVVASRGDGEIGQRSHGFGDFRERCEARDVAYHDMGDHPGAQAAQYGREVFRADLLGRDEGLHRLCVQWCRQVSFELLGEPCSGVELAAKET